jgi:formiminotetrahydrofolate cyclodeaminase
MDTSSPETLSGFLTRLGDKSPTPGGGAAAALVGAVAAALTAMAGNLTVGKKKFADVEAEVRLWTESALRLCHGLQEQIEADSHAFQNVLKAYKESGSDKEKKLQTALLQAIQPPLQIMRSTLEAMRLAEKMLEKGNPNVRTDTAATGAFGLAAVKVASWNVRVNLLEIHPYPSALHDECEGYLQEAIALESRISTALVKTLVPTSLS